MQTDKVIFARVQEDVRRAVGAYAGDRGKTIASAVADLLRRGLEAASNEDSVVRLEQSVSELRLQLSERDRLLQDERARSAAGEQREQYLQQLLGQIDQAPIGQCPDPSCKMPISAIDLVVRRSCKKGHGLTQVLERAAKAPGVDSAQVLTALGALGLVLALLAAGGKVK
jgi:hypothetical protein